MTDTNIKSATRLGAPFKVYAGEVSPFRVEVAKRIATRQAAAGQLADESVSAALRAQVRTEVAREFFRTEHGRDPIDAREIAATIAKQSRPRTQTVAGYDLTFSPVKSVSTLVGGRRPARRRADRTGAPGCRAGCAELHRTPRLVHPAGQKRDPAGQRPRPGRRPRSPTATAEPVTRTCTPTSPSRTRCKPSTDAGCPSTAGCCSRPPWLRRRPTTLPWSIISATGWGCGSRTGPTPIRGSGRCGRSSVLTRALNQRWSTRRVLIKVRQGELAGRFQRDHGRPPTPVEALQLAQQATLETRDAKHEPRTLAEQRATWHAQAAETLGGPDAVQAMISKTLNPISMTSPAVDAEWVAATAEKVLEAVEERRSTWQSWHVRAEAQRQVRAVQVPIDKVEQLVELLVDRGAAHPIDLLDSARRRHQRAGGVASGRRFQRVHRCRIRAVHLDPDPGRRAAPRRGRGPHRRTGPGRRHCGAGAAGIRRERDHLGCWAGRTGSFHVHLRGAAAAGDRARWRRENHRHAHPGSCMARQRRPRGRVGPVGRRGGATPRRHRRTGRNAGQAHLVHSPQ